MTVIAVKPSLTLVFTENRQLNIKVTETPTFNLHQGTDEPVLLQVSVQER